MTTEQKNLYVFGYGISLLFPALIMLRQVHLKMSVLSVGILIASVAIILFVVTKIAELKPVQNLWISIYLILAFYLLIINGIRIIPLLIMCASTAVFILTIRKVELIKPIYDRWMSIAQLIGRTITGIILFILYFSVFAIVGIILRIFRKDLLDQTIDAGADSYWIKREPLPLNMEQYKKQF